MTLHIPAISFSMLISSLCSAIPKITAVAATLHVPSIPISLLGDLEDPKNQRPYRSRRSPFDAHLPIHIALLISRFEVEGEMKSKMGPRLKRCDELSSEMGSEMENRKHRPDQFTFLFKFHIGTAQSSPWLVTPSPVTNHLPHLQSDGLLQHPSLSPTIW